MIFTTKAEYGVRLLVQLGLQPGDEPVSLKAIAESESLPLAYLERIAAKLKKAGFIASTRGAHGGYVLAKGKDEITMDGVILALEGTIAPMECFYDESEGRVQCSHEFDGHRCATKLMWTRVQHGVIRTLQGTTLAELVEFASIPTEREPSKAATAPLQIHTSGFEDAAAGAHGASSVNSPSASNNHKSTNL